jgi:tRNA1(Val) A37 N6-methylase TrmN6
MDTSIDAVLGGRLKLRQPLKGHRVGHDAILLAAATDGRAGEHAVDFGAGVGGAGLALARRVEGLRVTLLEIDPSLATLAAENATLNKLDGRVRALTCDVEDMAALAANGLTAGSADRVLMNPPFNDARRQQVSPEPRRRLAHVADPGLLERWLVSASAVLKAGGVLTMIWRAEALAQVRAALAPAFGDLAVLPIHPRAGLPPIRVLVWARKGGGASATELPGLVLNGPDGKPSADAEAVLRGGKPLPLSEG